MDGLKIVGGSMRVIRVILCLLIGSVAFSQTKIPQITSDILNPPLIIYNRSYFVPYDNLNLQQILADNTALLENNRKLEKGLTTFHYISVILVCVAAVGFIK